MRWIAVALLGAPLLGCPDDDDPRAVVPVDSALLADTAVNLAELETNLPPPAPDTFTRRRPPEPVRRASRRQESGGAVEERSAYAAAPEALVAAVEREQSVSRFCYQEFGQKADPTLRGNVVMVVTVGEGGIADVDVGDARWSGPAGNAVNRCLTERAGQAWQLPPGEVRPGRYAIPLSFRAD